MDQRGLPYISIFCLLVTVAVADLAGSSGQETALPAAPGNGWPANTTAASDSLAGEAAGRGHPQRTSSEQRDRVEPKEAEENEENEENEDEEDEAGGREEDYEGEDEGEAEDDDVYEDELKAVAESHEAMSRDDARNPNASSTAAAAAALLADGTAPAANNFDSREVITVNDSDEDVASNEAITDELVDKYDQEVAELVKFKKERKHAPESRTKTKRVPTVKKELSTQREILCGPFPHDSNETQVSEGLIPLEDAFNRADEDAKTVQRRNTVRNGSTKLEKPGFPEESPGGGEISADNRDSELEAESPKKLDKRQDLKSSNLSKDDVDDLLSVVLNRTFKKLIEDLCTLRKVLLDQEPQKVKAIKQQYGIGTTAFPSVAESSSPDPRNLRKRSKKKKKKPRHRASTTTLTPVPATPALSTTTETPWQTTPVQWRLVAERLFSPPWQQDLQPDPEKTNAGLAAGQGPRIPTSFRDLIERNKSKNNGKTYPLDRKPVFGKIDGLEAGRAVERARDFGNVYSRPETGRLPDYETVDSYPRLRYSQLSPVSRNFLRRQEEDYPSDFGVQADGYAKGQEYGPPVRDFPPSRSWPDVSYKYSPPWNMEERPLLPLASEKWPWRQSQPEPKHWAQRNKFLPLEKSYWSPLINEEDGEDVPVPDKTSQQARVNHAWDRHRSAWPVENPLKVPSSWHQDDRSMKLYDRDQSNLAWEKNDNRSDPSRLPTKHESKEKVVLPQITMKTWNSLTSDPATWPHKLPGAKPWPKDENGKSYNPNADLVKKLGLDKQEGNGWSKEEAEKSNAEKKSKDDKRKEEEFPHPNGDRSNFSDYRAKPDDPSKSWTILVESKPLKEWVKPENMQNDEAWRRKHEEKPTWTNDEPASLPKIQSMGAWVMSGDQSTWKPYQMKPLQSPEENSSRRWSKTISRSSSNEGKWPGKGSWSEKMNDSWMDRNEQPLWSEEKQVADLWKPSKPGSWFSKTSKTKDGEWLKPESAWTKINENDSWTAKGNGAPWSMRPNKPWSSKTSNDDVSKFNEESWPVKVKEEEESWKNGDTWPRKSSERNGWGSKGNELSPWQQKMNEDWSYGKSSTGTWPSKWKQFAYHRVTAMPISKPGTTADASSAKSKNAFVAVSAVSSQKNAGNEWRKIEDEGGRNENGRAEEQERSGNQVQVGLERPIYAWKKDPGSRTGPAKGNSTDPLENELEALRQIDFWSSYKENEAEKRSTSTVASAEKIPSTVPTNSTSTTGQRRATGSNNLPETSRRTISMK